MVQQGYLSKKDLVVRIRNKETDWYLTVKKEIDGKILEIENKISTNDALMLWPYCTNKIFKRRFLVKDWEIDFFYYQNEIYFVMAEIELPDGSKRPNILEEIKDYVVFEVPSGQHPPYLDNRFSNINLSNVAKSKRLYKEVTNEKV